MTLVSFTERSIFFRIYAGLLLVCLSVAFFAYLLVDTINQERAQSYRETVATGVFYLIGQGAIHQETNAQKNYWLNDISALFGSNFEIIPMDAIEFKARETPGLLSCRLKRQKLLYGTILTPINQHFTIVLRVLMRF